MAQTVSFVVVWTTYAYTDVGEGVEEELSAARAGNTALLVVVGAVVWAAFIARRNCFDKVADADAVSQGEIPCSKEWLQTGNAGISSGCRAVADSRAE